MSDSSATPGVDRRGYPVVTRREAHALAEARRALEAIASRARRDAYSDDARAVRQGCMLDEHASASRDALGTFLIVASVHADSETADAALERS